MYFLEDSIQQLQIRRIIKLNRVLQVLR